MVWNTENTAAVKNGLGPFGDAVMLNWLSLMGLNGLTPNLAFVMF